jgi:hypothetical protein
MGSRRESLEPTSCSLPFPFLDLPTELRLEIYKHLIPDNCVEAQNIQKRTFRHDQQPCYPAILRTNRQIYQEVICMWYGTARFHMVINPRHVVFLRRTINLQDAKLPSMFPFVRSLSITMELRWPFKSDLEPELSKSPWTELIVNSASTSPSRLQRVSWHYLAFERQKIPEMVDSYHDIHELGQKFKLALEWNLGQLRMMRGVDLKFDASPVWDNFSEYNQLQDTISVWQGMPNDRARIALEGLAIIRATFLKKLAEEVLQAS